MNQSKEINFASRRWVLVAGTGITAGKLKVSYSEELAAKAVGKALAKYGYGLVSGGWEGVDELVTKSFVAHLQADPSERLIQVVTEDKQISVDKGHIVRVPKDNTREWLEAQKFADAIILIGGRGGAYTTWLGALHDGFPRFPFGATTGDAEQAFQQTFRYWELMPVPGITRSQFEKLGSPVKSTQEADQLAQYLIEELLPRSLAAVDAVQRRNTSDAKSMFISYSSKDEEWISRLRTLLRPAERRGLISTWIDRDIEQGQYWEPQIMEKLHSSNIAVLMVSPNLLQSEYVKEKELPEFIRRMESNEPDFSLFWVLLEKCDWESFADLKKIQALGGVKTPIGDCSTEADKQSRLVRVVEDMVRSLSEDN